MFKRYQHIHFVGIGGIGMSGIAEILMNLGYAVSGSDLRPSAMTRRLKRRGATIAYGHQATHLNGANLVVTSSAIVGSNPEVEAAKQRGLPIVPRAEMLAELMRLKYGIAVAGTHGKTTTTSLIASVLASGKLDPTTIIGGRVNAWRTNARLGKGEFLVAEADESDRSFLRLTPTVAVITNIDPEHMENYQDFQDVCRAYADFADKTPFYGAVVCCEDHPTVRLLRQRCTRPVITYGISTAADYTAHHLSQREACLEFDVEAHGKSLGRMHLHIPGRHNVLNALAAIAVGRFLDIPFAQIQRGLAQFKGIERRFQILTRSGPLVVSDYAHHPTEIAATMQAARDGWPQRRLVVVHQPHRYTRLRDLLAECVTALGTADVVVLLPLYPAGEKPIAGVSARKLCDELRTHRGELPIYYIDDPTTLAEQLKGLVTSEDLVLFLGAGDISKLAVQCAKRMR